MLTLAPLTEWDETAHGLHRAAQLLGALRMLVLDPVPNYLELSLVIRPEGLSSGVLPGIGEVLLDFRQSVMRYDSPSGESTTIPLAAHSQASLAEALLTALTTCLPVMQQNGRHGPIDAMVEALEARGHPFTPKREDLADGRMLHVDPALGAQYGDALYRIFTATARFRARLNGPMTPVVVWPEHFDLSFLWFATERIDEQSPQMNFGFAPFSDDIDRPYLYAYAYPMPPGFESLPIPPPARWNIDGWQGLVFPYDELVTASEPEVIVERVFTSAYDVLSATLRDAPAADKALMAGSSAVRSVPNDG